MKRREIIYADPNDSDYDLPGARMSFFYMDGEAERRAGYDCCNGNIYALKMCLREGVFIATLIFPDGSEELCIVNSKYSGDGMEGLVCLLSDLDALKNVFGDSKYFPRMFGDDKRFLSENHPEVIEMIRNIIIQS